MEPDEVSEVIAEAFDKGRVEVTHHFWDELRADHYLLVDIRCALDNIVKVVSMGENDVGNLKFEVSGAATDGSLLAVVCSFKSTGAVLLITVYEVTQS